jgi:hypothetical protein
MSGFSSDDATMLRCPPCHDRALAIILSCEHDLLVGPCTCAAPCRVHAFRGLMSVFVAVRMTLFGPESRDALLMWEGPHG